MNRKRIVAIATTALATMAPAAAHGHGVSDLYVFSLFLGPQALLSLIAGLALSTYVKAIASGLIVGVGGIVIWSYTIAFLRPSLLMVSFVIGNALIALASHAMRRYWLSLPKA
jgi:hypothetical protein